MWEQQRLEPNSETHILSPRKELKWGKTTDVQRHSARNWQKQYFFWVTNTLNIQNTHEEKAVSQYKVKGNE